MPRIQRIEIRHIAVPLKRRIRHASHQRKFSDNVVVRVLLEDGTVGHGEGVPRPYVTGETIASTFEILSTHDTIAHIGDPCDLGEAVARIDAITFSRTESDPRRMMGHAARCALEIALLDAYGRHFRTSITEIIRAYAPIREWLTPRPHSVRYSGAVTATKLKKELYSAFLMRLNTMHQIKVKVGVAGQDDAKRLRLLRKVLGRAVDIRIDANEAWHADQLLARVRPLLPARPSALEQPVPHAEVACLAALRPELGIPIILDESLCSEVDLERAIADRTMDIANLRLSKCGGILPTLRLYARARAAGLQAQLGCHPGETGILSAAGRHVACNVSGWRFLEGSYDAHVLSQNLVRETLTFGYFGLALPISRRKPGLGITVLPRSLSQMTVARRSLPDG